MLGGLGILVGMYLEVFLGHLFSHFNSAQSLGYFIYSSGC